MPFTHTTLEAAKALNVSLRSLYRLREKGELKPGEHFTRRGAGEIRPSLQWDVEAVQRTLTERAKTLESSSTSRAAMRITNRVKGEALIEILDCLIRRDHTEAAACLVTEFAPAWGEELVTLQELDKRMKAAAASGREAALERLRQRNSMG